MLVVLASGTEVFLGVVTTQELSTVHWDTLGALVERDIYCTPGPVPLSP